MTPRLQPTTVSTLWTKTGHRALALAVATLLTSLAAQAAQDEDAREKEKEHRQVFSRIVITSDGAEENDSYNWVYVTDDGHPAAVPPVALKTFRVNRGYLGILLLDLTPELRTHFGAPADSGVMISRVVDDGPAQRAGLRVADIVTALDGGAVSGSRELARRIAGKDGGEEVTLEVWRDGKVEIKTAEIGDRQRPQVDVGPLLWTPDGAHGLDGDVVTIDVERFETAMEELRERMGSEEWRGRIRSFDEGRGGLLDRMQQLEDRIRELEAQLEEIDE